MWFDGLSELGKINEIAEYTSIKIIDYNVCLSKSLCIKKSMYQKIPLFRFIRNSGIFIRACLKALHYTSFCYTFC